MLFTETPRVTLALSTTIIRVYYTCNIIESDPSSIACMNSHAPVIAERPVRDSIFLALIIIPRTKQLIERVTRRFGLRFLFVRSPLSRSFRRVHRLRACVRVSERIALWCQPHAAIRFYPLCFSRSGRAEKVMENMAVVRNLILDRRLLYVRLRSTCVSESRRPGTSTVNLVTHDAGTR
jgi:hypothetical protein